LRENLGNFYKSASRTTILYLEMEAEAFEISRTSNMYSVQPIIDIINQTMSPYFREYYVY